MYQIRKATMDDTPFMYQLINTYADEGKLLHRTFSAIYENLQCFYIAENDGEIVGTASLHILDRELAEIRSLTVSSNHFGAGVGKRLVQAVIDETRSLRIKSLLSLTYQDEFFLKCGFHLVDKSTLPMSKIWKDCIHCSKFSNCDENAMIFEITF